MYYTVHVHIYVSTHWCAVCYTYAHTHTLYTPYSHKRAYIYVHAQYTTYTMYIEYIYTCVVCALFYIMWEWLDSWYKTLVNNQHLAVKEIEVFQKWSLISRTVHLSLNTPTYRNIRTYMLMFVNICLCVRVYRNTITYTTNYYFEIQNVHYVAYFEVG